MHFEKKGLAFDSWKLYFHYVEVFTISFSLLNTNTYWEEAINIKAWF